MPEEVLGAGVFVEPADQVADRVEKLLLLAGRGIEQHPVGVLEHRPPLMVRHPLEHLKLHALEQAPVPGEHEPVGHVEEVVRSDAHSHRRQVLRLEGVVEHPPVVGIRFEFGLERGLRPAVEGGIDPLHFHVGSLDDPDRHRLATGSDPLSRPGGDPSLPPKRIGHIGLQRDPGSHGLEPRPGERLHEGLGREGQIPVFLHVEVDEFRLAAAVGPDEGRLLGLAVKPFEPLAEPAERVTASDRQDLRVDRGDLDRQYLHVRRPEGGQIFLQPLGRLGLAEQGFAQEVEVHPQPLAAAGGQVLVQEFRLRRQDDVGRLVLEMGLDQGHGHRRQPVAEGLKAPEQRPVERAEEPRNPLHVEDVGELLSRAGGGLGAKRLVGQLDERRLVGRTREHPSQFGLLPPLGRRLEGQRLPLELGSELHRSVDQRVIHPHEDRQYSGLLKRPRGPDIG